MHAVLENRSGTKRLRCNQNCSGAVSSAMPLTSKQCSTAVSSLSPYRLTVPCSFRCQITTIPDLLMDIPLNPVWEYSVYQVTKTKATTHTSDTPSMSARRSLSFWRRMDRTVQKVCSSLSCFVLPPCQKCWTPLVWPASREVGVAGEKAKAS